MFKRKREKTVEVQQAFEKAIEETEKLKEESKDCYDYQDKVIEYLGTLGFQRVQK